ncbi:reprolysin-like metallopeptidase [Hymenobacter humi]|uniref:Reprolysin-like metallopeptidase n=1 Tax=Hymenobacter humi TaxID=1411620 RepID=A0ABW2U6W1_9BACT
MGLPAKAQKGPAPLFFRADGEARRVAAASRLASALLKSQALTLDVAGLRAALAAAPAEGQAGAAPLLVALPLPNGGTGRFAVRETSVMAPELAARFPQIKTYSGVGLDDAAATVRLDLSPQGFHAQVLTGAGNSFYIDPVAANDARHYLGFYQRDMNRRATTALSCGFKLTGSAAKGTAAPLAARANATASTLSSGPMLHVYRLALANTPEYALTKGNTDAGVMAAKVTTVNRVVGVYERELTVRMVLVPNNDQLNFLSGTGPQPSPAYTNNNGEAMLPQNQENIDRVIAPSNYDIGHVVSTGGGGVASLGVVCRNAFKAYGVTGQPNPVGDAFDIDFVAHEMGHQFGGTHTFNGNAGNCAGTRTPATAWEPGSGSTIMAYAGICESTNDLQPNSDPIFHTGSYEQIRAFVDATTCGTSLATGNTAPTVTAPAGGKTLPVSTPFKLTATAADIENDPLTYLWEELDTGSSSSPATAQVPNDNVPLFRSFLPSTSGTRYFPQLTNLVNNSLVFGERLPTVSRQLNFRCTVRDEHSGPAGLVGGINFSSLVSLKVSSVAGPFVVTAPNAAVAWTGGAAQTITWDVANTTAPPVSCAVVNLRLSLDGGLTYPIVLAQNESNDGSAVVAAPNLTTSQARLMVEAADNYFFDISNTDFSIAAVAGPTISSFSPAGGLPGAVVIINGSNLTGATAVSFNGTLAASFTVNSATQITATVAPGTSTGLISVSTPAGTGTSATPFVIGNPPTISGFTPNTEAVGGTVVLTGTNFTGLARCSLTELMRRFSP